MRKKLLSILLTLALLLSMLPAGYADGDGLPIDEEHFPDEAFRGYVAEEFDDDGDGYLNDEEIAAITEIDVSMMGISSLHGIEFFSELTVLFCLDNALTELDLSGNPKLDLLDCSFNSLTALDVTHNPALTSIDCSENAITALDVTKNPVLEGLFCYSNEIAALNLSGNPELLVLDCSMNALTALDLSGNPGLVMLECYGNSIAELDLSPCPTLVDIVTNGKYEQKPNFDSYTASSGNFVHIDPATKLITEAPGEGFTITVTDYTKGAAQTSLDLSAKYSGSVTFTVTSTGDRAVLVAVKNGEDYTALECVSADGEHSFTLPVSGDVELVLALKGDADLNGKVTSTDGTMVKRAAMGTYSFDTPLKTLVSDPDGDGKILAREGTMISRAAMGTYTLPW